MRFQRRRLANTSRRTAPGRSRGLARRTGTLEMLERREMLAGDVATSWHNELYPRDVNFDQRVTTSDLLVVINELLRNGPHTLQADQATPLSSSAGAPRPRFVDVNNDNRVSVADALMVVNELLATNNMLVTTIVTDLSDIPITQIAVGAQFKLQTIVQDIRTPPVQQNGQGVFSAGVDISFESNLSFIDTTQTVVFNDDFDLIQDASLQQGRVVGYASHGGGAGPNSNNPQFLFSVILTATQPGLQNFTPVLDTTDPDHEYGLYLMDPPFPTDTIQFVGDTLEILALPGFSINGVTQSEGDVDSTFNFTVQLSQPVAELTTVQFATSNGSATVAGNDYVATSGTLTFIAGQTIGVIPVTVRGDTNVESDETFNVVLSNPSTNASITSSNALGTILNDDQLGSLSIAGSTVDNVVAGRSTDSLPSRFPKPSQRQ